VRLHGFCTVEVAYTLSVPFGLMLAPPRRSGRLRGSRARADEDT